MNLHLLMRLSFRCGVGWGVGLNNPPADCADGACHEYADRHAGLRGFSDAVQQRHVLGVDGRCRPRVAVGGHGLNPWVVVVSDRKMDSPPIER